ncbi:MAG: RNA-directed DNA polymerase [Solobacterium sp.]|jgi:hypothetical protein|nr:RNA-directed DNA polymerase [Solobacterium sp.]
MTQLTDANILYEAGKKSIKVSSFKYSTQKFEMNQLLETAQIQKSIRDKTYTPQTSKKFIISERGKRRCIASNVLEDKTINHAICDEILMPKIQKKLIYDNGASQKGKGVSFTRRRLQIHMQKYFQEYHTNEGYILLIDFSGYYANIDHAKCKAMLKQIEPNDENFNFIIDKIFHTFELDVSNHTDEEICKMYSEKVNPMDFMDHSDESKTITKSLKKGVDIGNQLSQAVGILYPFEIDNYVKIVRSEKFYARYTDDMYIISPSKEELEDVLAGIKKIARSKGLIINEKKTRICKLSKLFRFLQIGYFMKADGSIVKKISPKNVTRERRRLKAYKRMLDAGRMPYKDIENAYRSWIGSFYKFMSRKQLENFAALYKNLFGKEITWKKARLNYLMVPRSKTSQSTETTTSQTRS